MTRKEFAPIMAYIATACGAPGPTREQTEIYLDLLGDLDAPVVKAAARLVVIDHVYPNLPPVGLIRKAVMALRSPKIPAAEAWELACRAVRKFDHDPEVAGYDKKMRDGLASLPANIARAVRAFGWRAIQERQAKFDSLERTRFIEIYDRLSEHEEHFAIMPPSVREIADLVGSGFGLERKTQAALTE